jgi:eukaryotic-like serine/threonine-protein kinase
MGMVAAPLCHVSEPKTVEAALKQRPNDTLLKALTLPVARAEMELRSGEPAKALESLQPTGSYERAYLNVGYDRGIAFLEMKKGAEAAAQFQKILDQKGSLLDQKGLSLQTSLYLPSYLGLAQGAAMAGDGARARKAYQDLLAILKDADPGNPYLLEARKEYAALH